MTAFVLPQFERFPLPTYGPKRDYTYKTEEPGITKVCRALGKEPQPWQRYVWAVATEYRLDAWGRKHYHYQDILVSVPRQSGKTTLLHPVRVYRMITSPGAHLFSTAQTQKHASKRMLDMVDMIDRSVMAPMFHTRRGKGDAGMKLTPNGADLAQFTPNEEAAHGETSPYFDLDEIWFYSMELGQAIMGGIRPSQITLHGQAQRWQTSTMGTLESEYMNDLVKKGREGSKAAFCYIEYSMPDGMDPYDIDTLRVFHPALGNTIDESALYVEMDLPPNVWLRAYCNKLTEVEETIIPLENWDDLARPATATPPSLGDVTVGFEVSPENINAAVVAAWHDADGNPNVHVLHQAPGSTWVIPYLERLHKRGVSRFAADDAGPVRRLVDAIGETLPIKPVKFAERRLADQSILTAARDDGTLIHDGSRPLRLAVAAAQLRRQNGTELLDRDRSLAPIPALIASSVALYVDSHPETVLKPVLAI